MFFRKSYRLYIGCSVENGKDWTITEASNIIISICRSNNIDALSLSDCKGIYTYNNGNTVYENTIILTLVKSKVNIKNLVSDLRNALSQESIMIECIKSRFIFK